jgi:hypothetical protein
MKGYVVTILQLPPSVDIANRCVESGRMFGVEVELFPAVYKTESLAEMAKEGLIMGEINDAYSNVEAYVGNFISQFRIWKKIIEANAGGIVLEHDAVFVNSVPKLEGDIINLGKPSYGKYAVKDTPGIYPMFSKPYTKPYGVYIPGAHGYYVSPIGAKQLVDKAYEVGVVQCDLFLNNVNFPDIKELYPWIIEARDSFTTIQKEKGCKAKHNYNNAYQILT